MMILRSAARFLLIIALTITIFSGASCSGSAEVECHEQFTPGATLVNGATEAAVNEEVTLAVSFVVQSSCGSFLEFTSGDLSPTEKEIAIQAVYDGCECTIKPFTRTANYIFKATAPGTYVLKFHKTSLTFITHTIVVS